MIFFIPTEPMKYAFRRDGGLTEPRARSLNNMRQKTHCMAWLDKDAEAKRKLGRVA